VFIFFLELFVISLTYAQYGNIKGKIIDKVTKQPIIGANVNILNEVFGAVTDLDGVYTITKIPENIYKIRIGVIGYNTHYEEGIRVIRNKTTYVREIEIEEAPVMVQEVRAGVDPYQQEKLKPASYYQYSQEEIKRSPGAGGDLFRSVESIPGVSSSGGDFSSFYVRGSSPKDNLILIDNIPFNKVAHFTEQGESDAKEGGRFCIFTPGLIESAEFQGGGFSAANGGKHSSLLDVKIKEGNKISPTFNGTYDILGWEINYDGPSYLNKNTSLLISLRSQDLKNVMKLIGLDDTGYPKYSDYLIKSTSQINPDHKLSVLGVYTTEEFIYNIDHVYSGTDLEHRYNNELNNQKETRGLIGMNWRYLTSKKSFLESNLFFAQINTNYKGGKAYTDPVNGVIPNREEVKYNDNMSSYNNKESMYGFKSNYTQEIMNDFTLSAGIEVQKTGSNYKYSQNESDTLFVYSKSDPRPDTSLKYIIQDPDMVNSSFNKSKFVYAGFLETSHNLLQNLILVLGIRYEYNQYNNKFYISPRINGKYYFSRATSINFAAGVYYQTPELYEIISNQRNNELKNEKAIHYILGLSSYLGNDFKFSVEGYYKSYSNVIVNTDKAANYLNNNGNGKAYGFDLGLVKRFESNYYGQISYSYSVSKRDDHDGRGEYNFDFSQPHIFSLLVGYQLDKEWSFSAKWKYASGRPTDTYIVHSNVLNNQNYMRYSKEIVQHNGKRLPDSQILKLRVDYRKQFSDLIALVAFIDIFNLYNHENPYSVTFIPQTGKNVFESLGMVPSFGCKLEL
jgi:hypothetical protein